MPDGMLGLLDWAFREARWRSGADVEYCCACDEPTGRAGKGDDSLYCEVCGRGPYCSECFEEHEALDHHAG